MMDRDARPKAETVKLGLAAAADDTDALELMPDRLPTICPQLQITGVNYRDVFRS